MRIDSELSAIAMNFGWLDEGLLSGCKGPRSDRDLAFLASKGIRALVRLEFEEETNIKSGDVIKYNIKDFYEPVKDFTAPSQEQIERVIKFIQNSIDQGKPVAVSCGAGYGRTGTILACYYVYLGNTAEKAIENLIRIRPQSSELLHVPGQKEAVFEFAQRLNKGDVK